MFQPHHVFLPQQRSNLLGQAIPRHRKEVAAKDVQRSTLRPQDQAVNDGSHAAKLACHRQWWRALAPCTLLSKTAHPCHTREWQCPCWNLGTLVCRACWEVPTYFNRERGRVLRSVRFLEHDTTAPSVINSIIKYTRCTGEIVFPASSSSHKPPCTPLVGFPPYI